MDKNLISIPLQMSYPRAMIL